MCQPLPWVCGQEIVELLLKTAVLLSFGWLVHKGELTHISGNHNFAKRNLVWEPKVGNTKENRAESLHGCPGSGPLRSRGSSAVWAELWSRGKTGTPTQPCRAETAIRKRQRFYIIFWENAVSFYEISILSLSWHALQGTHLHTAK